MSSPLMDYFNNIGNNLKKNNNKLAFLNTNTSYQRPMTSKMNGKKTNQIATFFLVINLQT
ncbi:hypothetical protein DERF_013236 [Dermatophagoides farinae]|uniref:Uncharacterized protein n=1 Tax=Dermatophagoides farinae TaxID=6954 RepID=A0A922KYB6_DERFA|nr:hypothetical protein DERF_013236 [Dermatophagoides farinae]